MKVSKTTIYFEVKSRDIQMSWGSAFRQTTHKRTGDETLEKGKGKKAKKSDARKR
jgi:hypothetical protein